MGRSCIQFKMTRLNPDRIDRLHFKLYLGGTDNFCDMRAVNSHKGRCISAELHLKSEGCGTTPTVAAHTPFHPVRIEIYHPEIRNIIFADKDQAICSNPEPSFTQMPDEVIVLCREFRPGIMDHNEIISRAMVFLKFECHLYFVKYS